MSNPHEHEHYAYVVGPPYAISLISFTALGIAACIDKYLTSLEHFAEDANAVVELAGVVGGMEELRARMISFATQNIIDLDLFSIPTLHRYRDIAEIWSTREDVIGVGDIIASKVDLPTARVASAETDAGRPARNCRSRQEIVTDRCLSRKRPAKRSGGTGLRCWCASCSARARRDRAECAGRWAADGDETHAQGNPDLVDLRSSLDQRHRLPRGARDAARWCVPRRNDRRLTRTSRGCCDPSAPARCHRVPRLASEDDPRIVKGRPFNETSAASARAFAPEEQ